MQIRHPVVAGSFYEGSESACRESLAKYIPESVACEGLPDRIVAGIVPHAGWLFSGAVAGEVFRAIAQQRKPQCGPEVFVLFGAMHRGIAQLGSMFADGAWRTPLGDVAVDERLAERILSGTNLIEANAQVHADEHSLEVIVPFIQYLFPTAKILPIAVPSVLRAHEIGQAVGRTISAEGASAVCIGSTDLTHYGPGYGFAPHGPGQKGIDWAKEVNDKALIDLICRLEAEKVVAQAQSQRSACGAGAVAATIGAARENAATKAVVLSHVCSAEVSEKLWGQQSSESVGYAGIVFG
ncbi:MAG: AmmeMemoRadiSam system protein B [Actinobacteria bacterium]|nr:AmmeMemoRadiSam system protein B [Actinomycetota bacterium]